MAPPTPLTCSHTTCDYETPPGTPTWEIMANLLATHAQTVHGGGQTQPAATNSKLEKLPRPVFTLNMTESQWSFTKLQWDNYISQCQVSSSVQLMQLQAACDDQLRQRVFDTGQYSSLTTTDSFLTKMKELAVVVVHKAIHLRNLWKMQQQSDEPIRAFAARLTATADMCGMVVECTNQNCGQQVNYREQVVHQLVIHGMRDNGIRIRVLSRNTAGELTTLAKLIDYIAAEEAGTAEASDFVSDANLVGGLHRDSSYKFRKQKCNYCGEQKHGPTNSPKDRKQHCKAWGKTCGKCNKLHHLPKVCKSQINAAVQVFDTQKDEANVAGAGVNAVRVANFFALETSPTMMPLPHAPSALPPLISYIHTSEGPVTTLPLPHQVHDQVAGWYASRPKDSPTIMATFSVDRKSYAELGLNPPRYFQSAQNPGRTSSRSAICDTGAQLTVVPHAFLTSLKIKPETIFPVETNMQGASEVPIMVDGGVLLKITAVDTNTETTRHSLQLAYVSRHVRVPYLSLSACIDLGLVPANFPTVASCEAAPSSAGLCSVGEVKSKPCSNTGVPGPNDSPCLCPRRTMPPTTPIALPCPPTEENLPILKQYILDRFSSSAFNRCEQQPLPLMEQSPPLRIFMSEDAVPVAVHTPPRVPLHWTDDVKRGLDRDCKLGVLEKVPVNDPVKWCHRMIITAKSNGEPRRVVDFTALNKYAPRQTHHTETPWALVSSIPSNKVKSTLDCWHGYHSVPLAPADRHLTTFITPWGRYRYRTAPQGLISAGDGYTHRKAEIMGDFGNVKNCVDDSLLFDDTIEENFFRVCSFLEQGAKGGCTFNPEKFQFGEKEVDFLGFRVTNTGVQPTQSFIDSIMSFPTPRSITDIRSWFGAVNQISYAFAAAPVMAPFRHLLSSKVPFQWSDELQAGFEASKLEIIQQCEKGVRSFDPDLPTALATDWAKLGIGWWLTQKHCTCPGNQLPGCCPSGWQTVYVGSRFCTAAESRYHPIEGEALASVNGLEKCKFFILGLKTLILAVDHKPLLAILSDKQSLDNLPNPRLMNFKLRSQLFRFHVKHIPGKQHVVPDTLSRRQDSPIPRNSTMKQDIDGNMMQVLTGYSNSLGPPSWVSTPSVSTISVTPSSEEVNKATELEEFITGLVISSIASINNCSSMSSIASINNCSSISPVITSSQPTVLSWARLEAACATCEVYKLLHNAVQTGLSDNKADWDDKIADFFIHRQSLTTVGPVVMLHDRPVIPRSLQMNVLQHLHAGHASANSMFERASSSLYWPGFRTDIINFRAACSTCTRYAPSNPALPPTEPEYPTYPFQSVCMDFFHIAPHNYLAVVDRYSNWLSVFKLSKDTSEEVQRVLRDYFSTFSIPVTITSDGATVFTSKSMEEFFDRWGVVHRVATAYHPRANKRSEVGVKSAKRLVRGNIAQDGTLNIDNFARAIMAHRNTPCPISGLSPAQIIFGRVLRDFLPLQPGKFQPRTEWRQAAEDREAMYAKRHILKGEQLTRGSKSLPPLKPGDCVAIQNQTGNQPRQWSQTGVVIEVNPHSSYTVSIDGSRTITRRNRQFLRKITPFVHSTIPAKPELSYQPVEVGMPTTEPSISSPSEDIPAGHQETKNDPPIPKILLKKQPRPSHLRERWIVASKPPQSSQQPETPALVTPVHSSTYPVQSSMSRWMNHK